MQSLSSMGKKRTRHQNPEPFLADENASSASENRNKPRKHHRQEDKLISSGMSSKIWKEAMIQQREVQEEAEGQNPIKQVFEEEVTNAAGLDEEDIDEFRGFSETQSHFGGYEEEIDEEDEKLLEAFMSKDAGPQRTLADLIVAKIKQKDAQVSSEVRPLHKLDDSIVELYKGVGRLLNKYTSGKIPKAFKHIPSLQLWEEVLYLTEPEKWSPNAMYQATRIFASNLGVKKAERFYRLFLLPRVREDIRKNKRLHFALYQALKKSMYKPAAFNKGILFPLCESRTCNLREAVIIGSIIQNVRIPPRHSSFALLRLAEMEYCGTTSYFIKLLIEKKYDLPYRVIDAMVDHYMKFLEDDRLMPVIWHQLLLVYVQRSCAKQGTSLYQTGWSVSASIPSGKRIEKGHRMRLFECYGIKLLDESKLVSNKMTKEEKKGEEGWELCPKLKLLGLERYKNKLTKEDKVNLNLLVGNQSHKLVTPEILRELNNSHNRGEKEDDLMSIASPISVINKTLEEDRFDIPDVPMEED